MESRNMNIYDIAKEAGVSISTVSRVLNHKGNVNPATRVLQSYFYYVTSLKKLSN